MALKEQLTLAGIDHDWLIGDNESLVHRARMKMSRTFLEDTEHDYKAWLDADIQFEPEDFGRLWALAQKDGGKNVYVGVYPMKKPGKSWFAAWHKGLLVKDLDRYDNPIEVDFAGTGFMLISRTAIEKVRKHLDVKYAVAKQLRKKMGETLTGMHKRVADEMLSQMQPDFGEEGGQRIPALYMTPIHNDGLESEDYHFCRLVREAGMKVIMDPKVRLYHWGMWAYGQFERLVWDAA